MQRGVGTSSSYRTTDDSAIKIIKIFANGVAEYWSNFSRGQLSYVHSIRLCDELGTRI